VRIGTLVFALIEPHEFHSTDLDGIMKILRLKSISADKGLLRLADTRLEC
jgi:hypothetical protein